MKILNGKGIFAILMTLMLGVSTSVFAYPLLTFNAVTGTGSDGLIYDGATGQLSILGTLTGAYDIATPINFDGSSIVLTAYFDTAVDDISSGYTFAGFTGGNLSIIDGDAAATTLLDGSLANLLMYGATGDNQATMIGDFAIATGTLSSEFQSIADLFALELNLSTLFNADIFQNEFGFIGDVYGTVSSDAVSVPEPSVLFLFAAGLLMLGFNSSRKTIS